MKKCTKCGKEKALGELCPDGRFKDGYRNECLECAEADRLAWLRPAQARYRNKPGNAEKQREYMTQYYQENADVFRERTRNWAAENSQQKRETDAAYRAANRDQLRAWHREHRKTPARRAAEALHTNIRRAQKKRTAVVPFTVRQLEAKFAYWNDCCWVCGDPATTVDHVKPLAAGGAHMLCNMRPACEKCNFAKHDAWPLPSRAKILGFCD